MIIINLFSEPPVDLLGGLPDPAAPKPTTPTPDPSLIDRTARMAALMDTQSMDVASTMQALTANTQKYVDAITKFGDEDIRRRAAIESQQRDLEGLGRLLRDAPQMDPTGELTRGTVMAAQVASAEEQARRQEYALEDAAIRRIQDLAASGDSVQAKVLLNNLEFGDAEQVIRDTQIKRLILAREIEKASIAKESQPWYFDVVNWAATVLPLNYSMGQVGNVDLPNIPKHWYDNLLAGQRAINERAALWNLNPADFAKYVREQLIPNVRENSTLFGMTDNAEQLQLLTRMQQSINPVEANAYNLIDNVGLMPSLKTLKGSASVLGLMVRTGARKEASNLMAQAVTEIVADGSEAAARSTGLDVADVMEELKPTILRAEPGVATVPLAVDAASGIARGQAIMETMPGFLQPGRFATEAERRAAIDSFIKEVETDFGRELKDVSINTNSLSDSSTTLQLDLTVGKKTGGGYAEARTAREAAKSMGYEGAEVFKDESGQWFFRVTRDMPETGYFTQLLTPQKGAQSLAKRFFYGSRLISDEMLSNIAQASGNTRNALLRTITERFVKPITSLSMLEREAVSQVLAQGEKAERWFTRDQFEVLIERGYKRLPTEKEWTAYQAAININDLEYAVRNDVFWKERALKGFETASFQDGNLSLTRHNAQVDRRLETAPRERTYVVGDGLHLTKEGGTALTAEKLAEFKAKGYILVKTEDAILLKDGTRIKSFLVKANDLKLEPLRRDQLGYRAGGHRMYEGKYFVKQAVRRLQPDTTEAFLENPNTYRVFQTPAEARVWSETMELARKLAVEDGISAQELDDQVFLGRQGYPTGEQFLKGLEDGVYEKNTPFEALYDRELPADYSDLGGRSFVGFEDETGFNGFLRTNGRLYYSGKGERLLDYHGEVAPTLDPYQTINTSLRNIMQMSSFSDYKITSIERWVKTFGKHLRTQDLPPGSSPYYIFTNAQPKFGLDNKILQAMTAEKNVITRNLGWKTEVDRQAEVFTRNFAEWVNGDSPTGFRNTASAYVTNWWANNNPVQALRGAAFDLKLGMFNPVQLPLQIGTSIAAITLSPKHGLAGFALWPAMRAFMTRSGTENMLDLLVKRGVHNLGGFKDVAEFKDFMRFSKRSGFLDVSGTHGLINDFGPNVVRDTFSQSIENLREAGRFFFNEGEIINRQVAMTIAWKELRETHPHLNWSDAEFLNKWAGRAEDYAFSMSKESQASWQKGLLSIPTQFFAYNARMLEAMLGPKFTPQQRLRLFIGQAALYGAAGVPLASVVADWANAKNGKTPDLNTFGGVLERGLFDLALNNMFGTDLEFSKRFGTGSFWADTVKELFGASQYGEKSFAEILGGPATTIFLYSQKNGFFGDAGKTVRDVISWSIAESGGDLGRPMTRDAFIALASNISTINNALKGYMVFKYGTLRTSKGNTLVAGLSKEDFATALGVGVGFAPHQQSDVTAMMAFTQKEADMVNDASRVILNYRTRMVNEPDNREALEDQISIFVQHLPDHIRRKALERAHRSTDPSLYDRLANQVAKAKAERLAEEGVQ